MNRFMVWDLPPDSRPTLSGDERRQLAVRHRRQDFEFVGDDETPLPIDPPVCECGERWLRDGCRTLRALAVLALAEHERDEAAARERKMTAALAEIGTLARWRQDPANRVWAVDVHIAQVALVAGGVPVIEHALIGIRDQMREKWAELNKPTGVEALARDLNTMLWEREKHARATP